MGKRVRIVVSRHHPPLPNCRHGVHDEHDPYSSPGRRKGDIRARSSVATDSNAAAPNEDCETTRLVEIPR